MYLKKSVSINGRTISSTHLPYIVAEMSGNHNGDIQRAFTILEEAKRAGADAVKLQTYRADTITIDHDGPEFIVSDGLWAGRRLYDLYEEAHTPWEWHGPLFEKAREIGLTLFSSPFDHSAVNFLEDLNVPAFKIASPEIVDLPLIKKAAQTQKPLIISTGTASLDEIDEAVGAAKSGGCQELILLHCISAYPTDIKDANLSSIPFYKDRYNVPVGLSDHSLGTEVANLAIALGACFVEKHFTLSREEGGVDSAFSIEPKELRQLVESSKRAFSAIGVPKQMPISTEETVVENRRSLYAVKDIAAGELLTADNVRSIRPALGLKPKYYEEVIGTKAKCAIAFGTPLDWDMVERKALD